MTYLLLNVLFGGLPDRLGADVERTGLTLAIVWDPVHRLETGGTGPLEKTSKDQMRKVKM